MIQVREMSFIESARAMGFGNMYILFRHILKNTADIIVARWSLAVASAMMAEAGLAFLGLGDPLQISWGGMISKAFNYGGFVLDLWWWYIAPGLMICICATAFIFLLPFLKSQAASKYNPNSLNLSSIPILFISLRIGLEIF